MSIKITKAFQWSPNGYDVATVDVGEYESLPERAGEIAAQIGALDVPAAGAVPVAVVATPVAALAESQTPDVAPAALPQSGAAAPEVPSVLQAEPDRRRSRRTAGGNNA
ncbi:hypothetical protein [Achromobacter denitrificans]|uniref:Uncharacterized protein n=1 Tax=Achromobacter denitrificans TaxID=32002 RepID=A0A6N0JV91_ACHDE|nr:hypothetical protein [Achromobacter denitrificans]QKQ51065.1 hypothetical protein FOC81_31825 [Achromobacter denitrificans]